MSSVLLCSPPAEFNAPPMAVIADTLAARGWLVRFTTGASVGLALQKPFDAVLFGPAITELTELVGRPFRERPIMVMCGFPPPGTPTVRADLLAQFTVPEFEDVRDDAPANLHFFGPVRPPASLDEHRPTWWPQLDGSRPVVSVCLEGVAVEDFEDLVFPTLRALSTEDVTVVVATGGWLVDDLQDLPINVLVAERVWRDAVMARTDVLITNGSYDILHSAMENGVPAISASQTAGGMRASARVSRSGVGIDLRTGRPSVRAIRRAVHRILKDPVFAWRSAAVGRSIRVSPGVDGLADTLEQLVFTRNTYSPSSQELS